MAMELRRRAIRFCSISASRRVFLPVIADRNANKYGARTPATLIPIISEEELRAAKPDYYFVLPWHFRNAFLARERAFIERGGKFVFPLPAFEVVPD